MKYHFVVASLVALLAAVMASDMDVAKATNSITKIQSGLVSSDSLTTGNLDSWTFGGTATLHDYYEDSQGLHLGIMSPWSGQWVNYYAYTPQPDAYLFHSTITIDDSIVSDGVSNVGLYVEGSDFVPHVGCEAYADWSGYYWVVEQSGDAGNTYDILYITPTNDRPLTQDCTIITNGDNYLKVYIDGDLVFSSTTMDLGMSAPLIAYFQDDTSSSNSMHYATYRDYYATTDENIRVINNPSNAATVKVVSSSGQTLAISPVTLGIATLDVGKYNFPLSAIINVYDSGNSVIASSPASIYGGDVFSVTVSSTAPTSPTGLTAVPVLSSQINLSWSAPSDDGGSPITGYMIERSVSGGPFSVLAANTGSDATTYYDTDLAHSTLYSYRVSATNSVGTSSSSNIVSATTPPPHQFVTLLTSGHVFSDPLNNETKTRQELEANQDFWHYGGSAFSLFYPPAPTDLFKDSQGLHVAVQTPTNGTYAGFYAVSSLTNATLFHAKITTPIRTISSDFFQNGLYVQTGNGLINYVTCVSITSTAGTSWHVVRTFGNTEQATQFEVLWSDPSVNQPLTRDCTIITNGNDYLKIYLDGIKIYQNNTIDLQMPGPFLYFLEPQNSRSQMLYGIYNDYYSARGETIQVTGLPPVASRVDMISMSGGVLATAPASNNIATLDVGMYRFPIFASIKVYDSNNSVITSTQSTVRIFGGDVYTVK